MAPKQDPRTAKVLEQFKILDTDGNGTLEFDEIRDVLQKLDPKLSGIDLQKLFCQIDANGNGGIDTEEFCDFIFGGGTGSKLEEVIFETPQGTVSNMPVRKEWIEETLQHHNKLRALHGSQPLSWSDECYQLAKQQANICQQKRKMEHGSLEGKSGKHGQNIYWCSRPPISATRATQAWYDEIDTPGYDFSRQSERQPGTGHFTAVVWQGSTHVGMAASEDGLYVVANYWPAGNYVGRHAENVFPLGEAAQAEAKKMRAKMEQEKQEKEAAKQKAKAAGGGAKTEFGDAAKQVGPVKEMTAELKAILEGCPFNYTPKIEEAFKNDGEATVKRESHGEAEVIEVKLKVGRKTSTMKGQWGCGCT
eukprot:TRINITY_DN6357_c0_g1_i2.p1 TRINITY_DN6357_c0_g1~~TRINITY_DN6357_c0_g1_i2.p1  ORF type:complete len:363 (-),score=98.70 TRINITY_DN6357_c0_g1_i2:421-1509(-)